MKHSDIKSFNTQFYHALCVIFILVSKVIAFKGLFVVVVHLLSHVQLFDTMDCSTPGSSAPHYLWEFAHIPVHWGGIVT